MMMMMEFTFPLLSLVVVQYHAQRNDGDALSLPTSFLPSYPAVPRVAARSNELLPAATEEVESK